MPQALAVQALRGAVVATRNGQVATTSSEPIVAHGSMVRVSYFVSTLKRYVAFGHGLFGLHCERRTLLERLDQRSNSCNGLQFLVGEPYLDAVTRSNQAYGIRCSRHYRGGGCLGCLLGAIESPSSEETRY
jgi:hypothetical protein